MQVETSIAGLRAARRALRSAGSETLGLVPTMGALHEGHLSLVRAARASCDQVAASIFVNPTQFAPNEDLAKYPRTFERDCELLEREGVALLFAPIAAEMYPEGSTTRILVGPVADRLDGASRPGHFTGVATIVAKLFHIFAPQRAFFGQKDAAQLAVLRQMVRDLDFDLELIACPIVREPDGLAMSSRNQYLSADERRRALVLSQALAAGERLHRQGERASTTILHEVAKVFAREPGVRVDYTALVDADTLLPLTEAAPGALLATAAYVGATRLIDNHLL
jgi:pantoate--beta-alanine ligase